MKTGIILLVCALSGCATAGPFVTRVQPLRDGSVRVRSCTLKYTWGPFGDSLQEGECTSAVVPPEAK